MATASAFGFSGYDPLGSLTEGFVGGLFGKWTGKNNLALQKAAMNHQYKLMIKGLQESPAAQRQGLINAGYNPMLAISNGLSHPFSGSSSASYMSTPDISSAKNGFDAAGFAMAKEMFEREKVQTENIKKQGELIDAEVRQKNVETGNQVLTGVDKYVGAMDKLNPTTNSGKKAGNKKSKKFNTSLQSSATTPKHSKGGSSINEVLRQVYPALLWSAKAGSAALGIGAAASIGKKAQDTVRKDKRSNYNKQRRGTVGNVFGIPSYHNH